jgi:hypothetical protein
MGAVIVVTVWLLDIQLHVQSVPITIKVVSSNPVHGKVYSIRHYVIKFVIDLRQVSGIKHHKPKPNHLKRNGRTWHFQAEKDSVLSFTTI